ncbi:transketolase family protein [Streptomyces olivaceus]|uniref:transketolase family protein n=1 Tax=Streptomyces olivaceus TaxID=47716 RepID=UPI001CCFA204|nr:transketolase C-terminal domain-containing protein [Streptomyces olivaceus]MBZ6172097.1 transketolase family protein [Streptomyces olivaceus]MBZ6181151.1 transketolase family protein [Streptomyces olivaceus]
MTAATAGPSATDGSSATDGAPATDKPSATDGAPVFDCRADFADELVVLARADDRIVAVCNDSVGSSNLAAFREEFPDRLINVGIAEQDLVGVSAGLANAGFVPFASAAAPFLTGRALEQIKADVAYSHRHVVLCGQSPGLAYGELGPTHHGIEDLSWMRAVPGLEIIVPADPAQTRAAVRRAAALGRPTYLRVPRFKVPAVTPDDAPFEPGRAVRLADGTDVTVVAVGTMVSRALDAAALLARDGISARVLNTVFVEPLDEEAVVAAARETGAVVTAEEGLLSGGLGAAVARVVAEHHPVPVRMLGVPSFAPTGGAAFLLDHFGLTAAGIADAAREALGRA